jgi:hypothetical protein
MHVPRFLQKKTTFSVGEKVRKVSPLTAKIYFGINSAMLVVTATVNSLK